MTAKIIPLHRTIAPPRKLGVHGMRLWDAIHEEVSIEDASGIELLLLACEATDRSQDCAAEIKRHGVLIKTSTGAKENPLLKIELANRAFVTRALARLGLEVEPLKSVGRPCGSFGYGD